ncbi:proprotein convertase subtilisin/kexin type 1 inhibitor, like [Antennarius striatus]|uniref:proprotein convertase subtilisin/kexin type 1 inhibitor, like n=1 Tax=Antennarius striatus TaxID=241820 RepID=UPI0035B491DA
MASLGLVLLGSALLYTAQSLPAARGRGHGLDVSLGGTTRQQRDLLNLTPYEGQVMSYPVTQGGAGVNNLYYQSDDWRGRGLDQALQRLVERDERREQEEEQQAAYLAALLHLLTEAERAGLVNPGDVEIVEEDEEEEEEDDDQSPQRDSHGPAPLDYDETGQALNMGRPPAAWWGYLKPQLAQALIDRMEPQLTQTLMDKTRRERPHQPGRVSSGVIGDQDALRRLVSRLISSMSGNNAPAISSGRRLRRDLSNTPVGSTHKRTRRSLDDMAPPSPSNDLPLLRVKRLEEVDDDAQMLLPPASKVQKMKHINTLAAPAMEELNPGNHRRRRRATLNYDPQILIDQLVEYMRE